MSDEVILRAGELQATYLPGLGMVCSSLRHNGLEMLAQRGGPEAYAERGSSFGIPLLYPWANRLSAWEYEAGGRRVELDRRSPFVHIDPDTGLPLHGLLTASRFWTVSKREPARLQAGLDFAAHPELAALFPFPHRLELTVALAPRQLSVRLGVVPTGAEPVPIAFGFHPYLQLPGADRREWKIELPVRRRALLDECGLPTGEHEPISEGSLDGALSERTFDDSFDGLAAAPVFSVADQRRSISIEFVSGWSAAQVFAPEGSQFICFEPMTAPVNALRTGDGLRWVAPGERFWAEFSIRLG
jgi:galactose mutarotase-like enzyme